MSTIDLQALIPNNVNLGDNRQLQRALEHWQPAFLKWWDEMGPSDFNAKQVYLRTAVGVDAQGWASYGYTAMPDYRWGIFLADKEEGRRIGFGDFMGQDVWQDVPGEFRSTFRRLIVTQGDTEPASVEQQRLLGHTAPSLYYLRNLFQVNVEEGRHLWAMVYLLHKYFGADGRDEADELLRRQSGSEEAPRMLGAFNETTPDWLSFFMFTYFTDRDGKMQLESLAQSGFDPLSRTCRFMLTEEAHHMFVGETGVGRTIQRTCEAMDEAGISDPYDIGKIRALGVIDLPTIQKKLNLHYSLSLDLFGSEVSTNAANAFNAGIKGRYHESLLEDDHRLRDAVYPIVHMKDGKITTEELPALSAINMRLRDDYSRDAAGGVGRWNAIIDKSGVEFEMKLPHQGFHRQIGAFAEANITPDGVLVSQEEWEANRDQYLPSTGDGDYIQSLMKPQWEAGKFAHWIAPPKVGIDNKSGDFEYVKLHMA